MTSKQKRGQTDDEIHRPIEAETVDDINLEEEMDEEVAVDRRVLFLSTKHHRTNTDANNKNKLAVNVFYNQTKDGVDTLDKLCHAYTVRCKTNRWPMAHLQNLIDHKRNLCQS